MLHQLSVNSQLEIPSFISVQATSKIDMLQEVSKLGSDRVFKMICKLLRERDVRHNFTEICAQPLSPRLRINVKFQKMDVPAPVDTYYTIIHQACHRRPSKKDAL